METKISIKLSEDYDLITSILNHESVFEDISDDFTPEAKAGPRSDLIYIIGYVNNFPSAVWILRLITQIHFELHTCILPTVSGKDAVKLGLELGNFVFNFTPCLKTSTYIPVYNRKAFVFANRIGFKREGISRKSFMKNDKLHDMVLLGITKEEFLCQQQSHT
jgi:hypothetical protein